MNDPVSYIRWFNTLGREDVPMVGGKNASLGEMTQALRSRGVLVPSGFATTADAYDAFLEQNRLAFGRTPPWPLEGLIEAYRQGKIPLEKAGAEIRQLIREATLPDAVADQIRAAYRELSKQGGTTAADVAVRSSATAEDLPEASFAGQQETFLGIKGEDALLEACRQCYASLFTDRAIVYREAHGFEHAGVALSIGVQQMVRADASGVLFTLDTETGFPDVVLINAAWGLGENVVQGTVTPDQYTVYKPFLRDARLVPILGKTVGAKEQKLVYGPASDGPGTGGRPGEREKAIARWDDDGGFELAADVRPEGKTLANRPVNVETSEAERRALVLADKEILRLARWGAIIEKHYGTPMDIEWAREEGTGALFIVQARPETVQARKAAAALKTYRLTKDSTPL
ncbi:MAG: PEP/pyruvate-binding domain-containing protein, partial [Rhodothermales bacterium]